MMARYAQKRPERPALETSEPTLQAVHAGNYEWFTRFYHIAGVLTSLQCPRLAAVSLGRR